MLFQDPQRIASFDGPVLCRITGEDESAVFPFGKPGQTRKSASPQQPGLINPDHVSTNLVLKLIPGKEKEEGAVTEEEINLMLREGAAAGHFHVGETEIVQGSIRVRDPGTGREWEAQGINAMIQADSLLGPARVEAG